MIRWMKRWLRRRDIERRLIAYAKTREGRKFIDAINENNVILADYDAYVLGAEDIYKGSRLRIRLPNDWHLNA